MIETAEEQRRYESLKATMEHVIAMGSAGNFESAEKLLAEYLKHENDPWPPHAQICNTCRVKAKVPVHGGFSQAGQTCLNCDHPT